MIIRRMHRVLHHPPEALMHGRPPGAEPSCIGRPIGRRPRQPCRPCRSVRRPSQSPDHGPGGRSPHRSRHDLLAWLAFVTLAVALPPATGRADSARPFVEQELTFLGFSRNEEACAWRQTSRRPRGGHMWEQTSIIVVVRLADRQVMATYRDVPPHYVRHVGLDAPVTTSEPAPQFATYAHALPSALWHRILTRAHFSSQQASFNDSMVRLQADDDSHLQVQAKNNVLHVAAGAGEPLGFEPVARMSDGALLPLGHVRVAGDPSGVRTARMRVFYSHSGHSVAVLTEAVGATVPPSQANHVSMRQTDAATLGTPNIGARARAWQNAQSVEDLFVGMHPEARKIWQENVGPL